MNVRSVLPRDAIPSIDDPTFSRDYIGDPDDEVIVVEGEQPRAYPIRILSYHEIVNDTVDDRPLAVTWCPICWSAVVYDWPINGRMLTFGVSGKLADDALVCTTARRTPCGNSRPERRSPVNWRENVSPLSRLRS